LAPACTEEGRNDAGPFGGDVALRRETFALPADRVLAVVMCSVELGIPSDESCADRLALAEGDAGWLHSGTHLTPAITTMLVGGATMCPRRGAP